jgi:hypothetical protein
MNKLMTMTNMNITLGYRRRGINAFRFPDDLNNTGVVAEAGQTPVVGVAVPTVEYDTVPPLPGSTPENV